MSGAKVPRPSTKPSQIMKKKYIDSLDQFCQDVEKAVNQSLPTGAQTFSRVSVMGLTWANDDLGCKKYEDRLLKVFREKYNYVTHSFVIPTHRDPSDAANEAIIDWIPRSSEAKGHELYILLYSGHGARTDQYMYLAGALDASQPLGIAKPWVDVGRLRVHAYKSGHGRFLHIFDTCQAFSSQIYDGPESISSAGFQESAYGTENSFTSVLARHLEGLNGEPMSVAQIYGGIVRKQRDYRLEATPIHVLEKDRSSIVLERQRSIPQQTTNLTANARKRGIDEMVESEVRVLISVNLAGKEPKQKEKDWVEWMTSNLPPLMHSLSIRVESVHLTDSFLLLVSMPIEIWDGLPMDQEAYNFISFIKVGTGATLQSGGSQGPPPFTDITKKENVPFGRGESSRGK